MPDPDPSADLAAFYYRGSIACVGSDDQIRGVEATENCLGELRLVLDDGRPVERRVKGVYAVPGPTELRLYCDHPDAP